MIDYKNFKVWFVTGSQHLYGEETLRKVEEHSQSMVNELNKSSKLPVELLFKSVVTTSDAIEKVCHDVNSQKECVGVIFWMHTFSPAKMWIRGLNILKKPMLHFHTQFNRDIPWDTIDMDFMNLNQSAHGDREFGYICTRMGIRRKVVTGHWQDDETLGKIAIWMRVAVAWADMQGMKIARFGDNMRDVAVTEGDKVEAEKVFGISVNGYGVGDLVEYVNNVDEKEILNLIEEYKEQYEIDQKLLEGGEKYQNLKDAARIEIGLERFLKDGNFKAFTTTFENLHGLKQLPGLAVQRLMAKGYGFGAEGDWKTAAMVRAVKVMSDGLNGGTTFMEDYTYHLEPGNMIVLGAHMLEVCESIASEKPRIEIYPLSIGGKDDPPRLIFDADEGEAINASLIDIGDKFRLIVNEVKTIKPPRPMPRLPVARVFWIPKPDLKTAATAWIYAGGAHHTVFSQAIDINYLEDFVEIAGIELVKIDENTKVEEVRFRT
ncbi:MAG: L-arabinose isomerase [Candidatus Marinimicrobia bacterium]|nr:L-arabinose isomerase [Candidatus Neomarinimicrobiota bacterium]